MEPRATLTHHRKSPNLYRFAFGRQTISVTRRFLPSRAIRVRVTCSTISDGGPGNWTEYRDFADLHDGDIAYNKQANAWCAKWEERYCSTPTQKETRMSEPTQEPTQERALCRVPADAPVTLNARGRAAVEGEVVGRVLGEYTVRRSGNRLGRSDAMLMLLKATTNHLHEADMAAHALHSGGDATSEAAEHAADLQAKARYFRDLRNAGFADDTTWDELIDMLRTIMSAPLYNPNNQRAALPRAKGDLRAAQRRSEAAELFLTACRPILSFFREDDGGGV